MSWKVERDNGQETHAKTNVCGLKQALTKFNNDAARGNKKREFMINKA